MTSTTGAESLRAIAGDYDAFFLDQFGVVHDGSSAYPGAAEAVAALADLGKPVVFVTNSGRPAAFNEARLARLGVPRETYLACVTSGDVAIQLCEDGVFPLPEDRRIRCLTISSLDDYNLSDRLGCVRTESGKDADLLVIAGSQADTIPMSDYEAMMRPAAERGVACICTNPDRHMLTPSGLVPSAGAIADLYAELGGPVTFVGKPHPEIYEAAFALIPGVEKRRILCVGDSIDHDIAGAAAFGAAAALVRTGILADVDRAEIDGRLASAGVTVDHILPALRW
ncbi:TIGR01459 family HAD-type hydrolase [Aurantimonas endophytica]|uniref:HAD superfamily hydrolase (TIGR01459 family) n=1 Tax=Aurantimonas endophytica TaxID=1522175 RepID=A0A7W6HDN1_9HYPH|nr:TIGR01459 family HAD-type hydrolase [Aurantimonas endophytica]MBB4003106.1 HAD superfamily hydrolase (TIGR01459 family) [Aurantimonas endophytica]MCO6403978.1 TIGR01459 family HAD-type hydrolase [Aurantimonas endophytica]